MKALFRRILVPHDFSEHATRALAVAVGLAAEHGGRLTVLHVVVPFPPMADFPATSAAWIPEAEIARDAERRLARIVARALGRRRVPKATSRVVVGNAVQSILDAARGHDTIVMATAGRSGLAHFVIGSVAEKVVRHAPVPVLTIHPSAGRRRGRAGTRRRR